MKSIRPQIPESHSTPKIKIGRRTIGSDCPTYIIAEIGINHNGDADVAEKLVEVAAEAKVDAVKLQRRHLPSLYTRDVLEQPERYEQNFQYMIPLLQEVELSDRDYQRLQQRCQTLGLEFLCTPFDLASVAFLEGLGVSAYKIASADLTNPELLVRVAGTGRPMLVSTGMSYWREIEAAVSLLREEKAEFALLHCRSVYPVWPREVNLRMINRLRQFGCPVGYSGHDIGITIPLVAASMGASIIEKHITLDRYASGPDHKISLEPYELKRLVRDIRVADQAMGKSQRFLLRGEILNRELFGKSLMAAINIATGTRIERSMIRIKGPGKGLSPLNMDKLIGRRLGRDLAAGDYFLDEDLGDATQTEFPIDFRSRWGLISRFSDAEAMLAHQPRVIEFHLAEKDFQLNYAPLRNHRQELIVHTPEYVGDRLLDLCSGGEEIRTLSVAMVQKTIALTLRIAPRFQGQPKVIVHPGAMSLNSKLDETQLHAALLQSLTEIGATGVELLLENLPPYPWYFGGQWKGCYFLDDRQIKDVCRETGLGLCFDLSHAALYCNAKDRDLADFIHTVKPYIRHIHFADAYGLDGEGVQIGEGDIDLDRVMPLFADYNGSWVPEIWRGHLEGGKGFAIAMTRLAQYDL